ncbi:hypothetical protein DPMN_186359 [Dreissena polymorpha]|uniref:Uncharacterized protein n=1 Tax=Dreissena polymorpha TaxID=45954 RepID=A0A9D4DMS5_DREPO|nr:hypothetical protein DPMN_186359 [Dreissena polymorpha]
MVDELIEVLGLNGSFATVNCTLNSMKTISAETPLDVSKNMSPISQPKDSNNNVLDMSYNEDVSGISSSSSVNHICDICEYSTNE